jgi:hypothetical protein
MPTAEGFTDVAEQLSEHYGTEVTRQQVFQWWKRETYNKSGRKFPAGILIPGVPANRPNRIFDMTDVIAWVDGGVPVNPHAYATGDGDGWRTLGADL